MAFALCTLEGFMESRGYKLQIPSPLPEDTDFQKALCKARKALTAYSNPELKAVSTKDLYEQTIKTATRNVRVFEQLVKIEIVYEFMKANFMTIPNCYYHCFLHYLSTPLMMEVLSSQKNHVKVGKIAQKVDLMPDVRTKWGCTMRAYDHLWCFCNSTYLRKKVEMDLTLAVQECIDKKAASKKTEKEQTEAQAEMQA